MSKTPTVSVVTSVYNGEMYLSESIESILQQSYSDFEFIIIDDGSNDRTPEILNSYTTDSRIIILTNPKKLGLSKSFNIGIKNSSGEYIARHDADDISMKNRLTVQKTYLDQHQDVSILASSNIYINQLGEIISVANRGADANINHWRLFFSNPIIHSSTMYRKSQILSLGGYDENLTHSEDYDLWCRAAKKFSIIQLPDILVKFRKHKNSFTHSNRSIASQSSISISQKHISNYLKREVSLNTVKIIRLKSDKTPNLKGLLTAMNVINELTATFMKNEKPNLMDSRKIYKLNSKLILKIISLSNINKLNKIIFVLKAITIKYKFLTKIGV